MELQFYGANAIKVSTKKISIVIDDNLAKYGLKPVASAKDIVLATSNDIEAPKEAYFVIDQPGEYEVSDVSIQGIPARSHMDEDGKQSTTMYRIILDGLRIGVTGHVHPNLKDTQLEALGSLDILFVPVGGSGFTLDGLGAHKVIKEIEPRVVIPTHYNDAKFNFEVPQSDLDEALKTVGLEVADRLEVLKMKNFEFGEGTKLIILNRQ